MSQPKPAMWYRLGESKVAMQALPQPDSSTNYWLARLNPDGKSVEPWMFLETGPMLDGQVGVRWPGSLILAPAPSTWEWIPIPVPSPIPIGYTA